MNWLVISLLLSVVLTVALNLVVRAFPASSERAARRLDDWATSRTDGRQTDRRVRVYFPWKAMLLASLLLTVALNALLWLGR